MRKLIVGIFLLFLVGNSAAYFVGVSPPSEDLGEVERGKTYEVTFYLNTDFNEELDIDPQVNRPPPNIYRQSEEVDIEQVSFEDVSSWIDFRRSQNTLSPGNGADLVNPEGKVTFFLDVPRTAEPGHHWVRINPNPQLENDGASGTSNWAVSSYLLKFRVPGEVNHELEFTNVEGLRAADDKAVLEILVENTGSVTTVVEGGKLSVFEGSETQEVFAMGGMYIAPGETKTIEPHWTKDTGDIQAGNYRMRGNLNYVTGSAFLDETFDITSFIQIQDSNESEDGIIPSTGESPGEGLPVWLIVMILVLIGAVMYSFEIDPLLIILAIGALGISIFIVVSGLPIFLVAVVLLISVILFYYGWI